MILNHSDLSKNFSQLRHASVVCDFRSSMIPKELYEARRLRTLFLFSIGNFSEAPCKLFSSFKYLRELDLSGCGLMSLDDSIGDLLCLSYLDLSNTHIKMLPRNIEKLHFLQTLNLAGCYNLVALPNLANMTRLRHLNNSGCTSLTTMLPVCEPFSQPHTHPSHNTAKHRKLVRRALPAYSNQIRTLPLFVVVGMGHLDSLGLYWGDDQDCPNINPEEESAVSRFLERKDFHSSGPSQWPVPDSSIFEEVVIKKMLRRQQNLKRLLVKGYPGNMFPPWIDLINLTVVELIDCEKCELLPTLGYLSLLKSLFLRGMHGVRHIGKEFYGESTIRPFLALSELVLIDFPNLQEWISPDGGEIFPSLSKIIINKCWKLQVMPEIISNVQHLELRDCPASLIHYFRNLVSLTVLVVQNVKDLSSFPGVFPANNPPLTSLEIISCHQLILLPSEIGKLTSLKSLKILWCEELSSLPQDIQNLNALESLEIGDCHSLMFLPEIRPGGLSNLRTLSIENCSNLSSLPMGLQHHTSLEHLTIMYCPSLITLPQGIQNLSALRSLTILSCAEFVFLPDGLQNLMGLQSLEIRSCPKLAALPEWIEKLVSLRSLAISDCHNIRVLPEGIKHLTVLQHLSIQDCSELLKRSTPESGEDWLKVSHVPYKHIGSPEQRQLSEADTLRISIECGSPEQRHLSEAGSSSN
ncbi:hypothetical protein FEM48_Zijuj09G0091400 [Ziziphus jujuba var. spinosa]|uniref:Uncharacterized protein n=1 Tax=Ziziphus jujuba var. spinosa TaxID=714518 RepID=A0A978US42_ZIZJJ|nr:hypothetical protein FEM48_Zijuj09G0091400 [Ziziphus jujuba var. spinosa]